MCALNAAASELALRFDVHAATDITGFGLLVHAHAMAAGSRVSLIFDSRQLELLPEALDYSRAGFLPGGLKRNREFIASCVGFTEGVPDELRNLLYDPQTSGGLFLAVAGGDAPKLLAALREGNIPARQVGEVIAKSRPPIQVR
jgi:selenide,water dikinase